ncbi:hypothetical protein [Stenotrophomonas sp. 278]|uniref:hypothetical protein n=1 Tax=Stenotrophomonas sp. 278 TaxID=2479851 RepID=UPI000F683F69|nr:hypothetical protein [Stenotrophomonas sp. 278]RRU06404.1 hypothetical protein EGJ34_17125 [Stenotrophomonas sp. 278]
MAYLTISAVGVPVADARPSNGTIVVRIGTPGEGLLSLSAQEAFALARGLISAAVSVNSPEGATVAAAADINGGTVVLSVGGEPILKLPVETWTQLSIEGSDAAMALQGDRLRAHLRSLSLQLGNSDLVGA